jgi:phytoene dehydrogenase-like protein
LVGAVRQHGGQVHFRQEVTRLIYEAGKPIIVKTRRGEVYIADIVIANLTPANLAQIMADSNPTPLSKTSGIPEDGWGAFVMYLGIDGSIVPTDEIIHHQVIAGKPLGEGNSIFISISPAWDTGRAPQGQRVITISTHTSLKEWWNTFTTDKDKYEDRKASYADKILNVAETAIPRIRQATRLMLTGTPITFQHFTHRARGWVGGYPQTHLFRTKGPHIRPGLWMVGDSIFPGQSTTATALGGIRVARQVLNEQKC